MRALVRSGDRASALRQAGVHGQLVWSELATEPDPAVLQLAAEIRRDLESAPAPPTGPEPAPRGALESAGATEAPIRAPRGSARVVLAAGLAAGAMAAALLVIKPWQADPDRVQIEITPPAEPTRDSLLASRLGHEILLRQPGLRVSPGIGRKAAYLVIASSRIDGDSVYLVGTVSEASGRRLDSLGPIAVETRASRTGMQALGEQAAIAIAAARSPLFRTWAAMAAVPETWGSFQALEEGIRGWQFQGTESLAQFDLAASRDPGSATPWVWKALTLAKADRFNESDSVLAALDSSPRRFGPWDRAIVAVVRGWNKGDLPTGHAAGHRLLEIAPNSEWAILASYDALGVGRAREALELLRQIPSDVDWVRHWANVVRLQALYQTGDHTTALADARARLQVDPENTFNQQTAIKALAALGRVAEVEDVCVRALSQRRATTSCDQAILELRGRGHAAAARRLADRVLVAVAASGTTTREELVEARADLAYRIGDWIGLERVLSEASRSLPEKDVLWYRVRLWAAGGDRPAVGRALAQLAATGELTALGRAEIAALLGDKDEAVELIGEAFRNGFRRGFPMFLNTGLDRLRGYPPFEALVRPIDDAEHRAWSAARK